MQRRGFFKRLFGLAVAPLAAKVAVEEKPKAAEATTGSGWQVAHGHNVENFMSGKDCQTFVIRIEATDRCGTSEETP